MSLRSRLVMKVMPSSANLPQALFSSTTAMSAGTGCFASTSLLRSTGNGNGGGDANFNSTYKPVEWHKDSEDVTNEGDLPSAARLINKDLPSAEEASKMAESWGTEKPSDDE
eukprot:GFYU01016178.1.p2 GENE.GFYU01016178.1~~GFYU01016178.1.p2  ORF type:complete len:112 (-),score=8.43 GFYU01016178.1:174-509(-)